jgi:hypothetical protein
VHALGLELFHALFARLDTSIVRVVNDNLAALHRVKVENLLLQAILDDRPELFRRCRAGACGLLVMA